MKQSCDSERRGVTVLTPRERDCLRLMATGLRAAEVAAELAISHSTLNAHFSAARRKLGVATTVQAVLKFVSAAGDLGEGVRLRPRESGTALPTFSASQIAFLDRLAQCSCLTTAWQALHDHVAAIGVTAVNLGLLTNPDGIFGEKDYYYRSSLPDELTKLYYLAGGPRSDPIIPYVAHGGAPVVRDPEGFWAQVKQFSEDLPASLLQFGEALIDFHLGCALCVPLRDADTGAPFCLVFCFDRSSRVEFQEAVAEHERNLSELAQLFWAHLQSMRMLSGLPGLTAREREALMLVVRGFAVCEVAERMQVSGRSAEKFLAGARSKLGARNNAQAVYRAMVYRALF